jgi:putative transcriptional regulator
MSKRAFSKIAEGLEEALSIARGDIEPARLVVPKEIDVKEIRSRADLSQEQFAAAFGFTATQVKDWEQGRSRPTGGNRAYLMLIRDNPSKVRDMLVEAGSRAA